MNPQQSSAIESTASDKPEPSAFFRSFARQPQTRPAPSHQPQTDPWPQTPEIEEVAIQDAAHSQPPKAHTSIDRHATVAAPATPHTQTPSQKARVTEEISATEDTPDLQPITPVWEVDVFEVPTTVADLFFEGKLFGDLGVRLTEAAAGGLRSMMITSSESGEGKSSVAIGMALAAAASGLKVALVDADIQNPTLVDDLRLDIEFDWTESIRSGLPIAEIAVHAIEDGVTLIPLLQADSDAAQANPAEIIQIVEILQNHFEMVIVDGPSSDELALYRVAPTVDSAIIVRDISRISAEAIAAFADRLKDSGVRGVGVVENFTAE